MLTPVMSVYCDVAGSHKKKKKYPLEFDIGQRRPATSQHLVGRSHLPFVKPGEAPDGTTEVS